MGKQPMEYFMPPNMLKAKLGGTGASGFDMGAVQRAEKAVEGLKDEFDNWIHDDVEKLSAARDAYEKRPSNDALALVFRIAHDLKGQATTFDFPLVTRVASSLCVLTEMSPDSAAMPLPLIDAHVNAIKVIVRDGIRDASDKTASTLAAELERQVSAAAK